MDYYAGLDVSLEKTHICVLDRDGAVMHEATAPSSPTAIATALGEAPACTRVVFETGRMAPMLGTEPVMSRYGSHTVRLWPRMA